VQKTILSTADVARLFNVTETTVKRWADDGELKCQKTPGGHRKFEIRSVIEFADKNHFDPVGTLELSGEDRLSEPIRIAILSRDYPTLVDAFVAKALSPDRNDLYEYLTYLYEHKIALWEIYDLVVRAGMREIGARWVRGEVDISHEHRASAETMDALSKLQTHVYRKAASGKKALLACLDGELHEIGLHAVANIFDAEGWHAINLGARTPYPSIVKTAKDLQPDVVCISITQPQNITDLGRKLAELETAVRSYGGRLVVGGSGAADPAVDRAAVDAVLLSAKELTEFISHGTNGRKKAH
jgi:excisionase family DNA binding protein